MNIGLPARLAAALAFLFTATLVAAQDTPPTQPTNRVRLLASGPRTSPFNPPDKDVFLTDASGGLDTGCTFNTSPLNPLTIDIAVDRFVGDVDANGFLVNPAPLVAAGIIPGGVDILLPAYDVDFNGSPPPERDEVLFNGQSLGFLTGDNNVWKLNTFRVDIRKIKFPARPAPGGSPVPVNNRLQIRIDTLGSGRWCTSVDWVALLIPIRPKLALDLDVLAGNPIRSLANTPITKIQEQTFDANCAITTTIGPFRQYPFSGPALTGAGGAGTAKLRAKIKVCPADSIQPPKVDAEWSIPGTTNKGTTSWTGLEGNVEYRMPDKVGAYEAEMKLTLDNGQVINANRKLFVTKRAPLVADPRINWYELGTTWASGQTDEATIVSRVADGEYAYGTANWRYGYFPGKCNWQQLVDQPITCNYSDCYVFSDVLQNISGTLGVGGLSAIQVLGRNSMGFITDGSPSIDPAFRGNTRQLGTVPYNRYRFSSHSLRLRGGTYYDATFNGRYATSQQFISFHFNGTSGVDAAGSWEGTDEGKKVYARAGNVYDSWGKNDYAFLTMPQFARLASFGLNSLAAALVAGPTDMITFPGSARFRTVDTDGDGRFEALEADVDLDVRVSGDYVVLGRLERSGVLVANRPAFESMLTTRVDVSGAPGRRVITLRFSGEQIRRSGLDGPYTLVLAANGDSSAAGSAALVTPAYSRTAFGELKAGLQSLAPTPVDADGSGKYEALRADATADIAVAGNYELRAAVTAGGVDLGNVNRVMHLAAGSQPVALTIPATAIARSGVNGPYEVTLSLLDATGSTLDSRQASTGALLATQFEGVIDVAPLLVEQTIDSNGNALFDLLRVSADLSTRASRSVSVVAHLVGANGAAVTTEALVALVPGSQRVSLEFLGPQIRRQQMDSQYVLELSFRDPVSLVEIDAARIPLRGVYVYTKFDSGEVPRAIALTGTRTDRGIDTNGNGLFDQLSVTLGVQLANAGVYEWSARLVDKAGAEIGFAAGRGSLAAGTTSISLSFEGRPIGTNGFDGPYSVRSLLMAGPGGANLVSTFAGETSAYSASQFEGFTARLPGDINGDGVVNAADVDAFNRAFGASIGDPNYNRFADFDRDGRVTLNDLRIFRTYLRR